MMMVMMMVIPAYDDWDRKFKHIFVKPMITFSDGRFSGQVWSQSGHLCCWCGALHGFAGSLGRKRGASFESGFSLGRTPFCLGFFDGHPAGGADYERFVRFVSCKSTRIL